jgi:hypothetical protein
MARSRWSLLAAKSDKLLEPEDRNDFKSKAES